MHLYCIFKFHFFHVFVIFSCIFVAYIYHSFQIGMDMLLYAWTGPITFVAKTTVLSIDPDTIVGGEPLDLVLMRLL
jgi:hypothetical protein